MSCFTQCTGLIRLSDSLQLRRIDNNHNKLHVQLQDLQSLQSRFHKYLHRYVVHGRNEIKATFFSLFFCVFFLFPFFFFFWAKMQLVFQMVVMKERLRQQCSKVTQNCSTCRQYVSLHYVALHSICTFIYIHQLHNPVKR